MQVLRGLRGLAPSIRFPTTSRWTESFTRGSRLNLYRGFSSKKVDPYDVVPRPEASKPGEMPDSFKQATGMERAEIEHPDLFKHNEVLRGAFGTKENPVKIPSIYEARIVGCTGREEPEDHELNWLEVEKDKLCVCHKCGQCFVLDQIKDERKS